VLKAAIVLAVPFLLLLALVTGGGILVVDVKAGDGSRIVAPVPLLLVQAVASATPELAVWKDLERDVLDGLPQEARLALPAVRAALDALDEVSDAELVRVESPGQQVVVRVHDDHLEIRVQEHEGADVHVRIPFETARALLADVASRDLHPADVVRALRRAGRTDLVRLRDGNEHVRVWIW
jgi:hypothetical protein